MRTPVWNAPRLPALVRCGDEQQWNARQLAQPVDDAAMQLWRYDVPGVVLGCAQRAAQERTREAVPGVDVVTRLAGGGAVLTGPWMLSASVLLPHGHALASERLVHSYRWLGELYAGVLRAMGIPAHAITPDEARALRHHAAQQLDWACYGAYSPWEVVVGHRKIVGLAQVRRRNGVLLVAGLQLARPDWPLLARALGRPAAEAAALAHCNTSCQQQAGAPGGGWTDAVAGALRQSLCQALFASAPEAEPAEIY